MSLHALHCNYLAWYIIPCLALLLLGVVCRLRLALLFLWFFTFCLALMLLVIVCHPSLYAIFYCGLSPSPCSTIVSYCGLLSLALPYCSLLWCVTLALCCCCSLWFVIPHLVLLLHHSMPFPGTHSIVLLVLFIVVCHSLPCVITNACLLK